MKKSYLFIALICTFAGLAQAPADYYSTATGTGYTLKTQLKKIIDNVNDGLTPESIHIDKGYGAGTSQTDNGLWSAYGTSDRDNGIGYENDNTIVDIYSENPSANDPYNFNFNVASGGNNGQCGSGGIDVEGDCYNREHLIPQSYFGGEDGPYQIMRNDIQHVYPTDKTVNGIRSNFAFGKVDVVSYTSQNGSKLGSALNSGYSAGFAGTVFEPIDEFKGDIARVFLYFATRYEDDMDNLYTTYTSVNCRAMFNGSTQKVFSTTFLNILLTWHQQDPVSAKEIARNNACYTHQGNRNPYIDNPQYVEMIWNTIPDTESPTVATNLAVTGTTSTTVSLSWTAATDNSGIGSYDVYLGGILTSSVSGTTATISGLTPATTYSFYVIAKDFDGNVSPASTNIEGTTTTAPTGGTATELFFSEYVEGSSSNKALEIANFTGNPVDLSIYSLKKQTNGGGAWLAANTLTGTLNNGSVFVAVDALMASTCYALANANISYTGSVGSSPTAFNGNDPIGLFKNDVLIDIIGTFDGGTANNFAENQTLRRKSTITSPNTTFNKTAEWDQFPSNTCNDIGSHTIANLSTENFISEDFIILPNPSNGNFNIDFDNNNKHAVEIYSSIGQKVFENYDLKVESISVTNLQQGIYFIRIIKDNKSIVKKIIITN